MNELLDDLRHRVAHGLRSAANPLPRVRIELRGSVPVWLLRLSGGVVAAGCAALTLTHGGQWLVALLFVAAVVGRPGGAAPPVTAVATGLLLLASPPFGWRVFALALGVHLLVVLTSTVGQLPWRASVERGVLVAALVRLVAIQAFTQAAALLALRATSRELVPAGPLAWLPLVAGVGLAAVVWAVVARLVRAASTDRLG